MSNISIITQEDKFFIPKNIKLLIDNERINVKSIHIISAKGSLENKKIFFFKSFLFGGALRLGIKFVLQKLKEKLDKTFSFSIFSGEKSIRGLATYNNIDFSFIKDPNSPEFTKYLPHYSGLMPSFWVFYYKEKFTGSSVHLMDSRIDNGKLVLQEKINIEGITSIYKLNAITKKIGGELMLKSIIGIVDNTISLIPNNVDESKYFTWPTNQEIKYFIKNGGRIY